MAYLHMANTSNVKEMELGRPQSVQITKNLPNCSIITLGTVEDHVRQAVTGELTTVEGAWVVVAPEINDEQYRLSDGRLDKFGLVANDVYTAYQLQKLDRIEYSDAYFKAKADAVVGAQFTIDANGKFVKVEEGGAFVVISVKPLWMPTLVDASGALAPQSVNMIKLEVIA